MSTDVTLTDVRQQIDHVDRSIVDLLAERQRLVETAGRLKKDAAALRAPERVASVIANVRELAEERGASPDIVENVYRTMIDAFITLELSQHETNGGRTLTDDILAHASNEWLSAADVIELAKRSGVTDPEALRDLAIGLITQLMTDRMLLAGDLDDSGFEAWKVSTHEAIDRIRREWTAAPDPFVRPGEIAWLDTSEAGQARGEATERRDEHSDS